MPLGAGSKVGPYEIIEAIGAGGMGQVFRARDTRLERDVALKILPDAFAADPERLARFEREARTLAALNHPNIAQVYDAGKADATTYLAMELVPGEDLSALIARGPIAPADALPIARQIIDALEAAHELGIVHRDLKPANIKVRDDGTVKVLDFGLAKAMGSDGPDSATNAMNSPTLTARATQMGVVLGTAAYMAPEQARGRPVDRRADIWAFGVVLYEMLSGTRAFEGEDISVTLANVIKEEARWDALPANLPPSIRRVLRRCLEKDPRRRLSAIADARLDLDEGGIGGDGGSGAEVNGGKRRATVLSNLGPALAGAAFTAILVFLIWPRPESQPPAEPILFSIQTETASIFEYAPRISPDGRLLAYAAPASTSNGKSVIWIRSMNGLEPRLLPGTEGASTLFWSTGSDFVGYWVGNTLYRVAVSGAAPQKLCDVPNASGATWTRSGDLIASSFDGRIGKLWRVPGQGGQLVELPLPKATGAAVAYVFPTMLDDDKHVLYYGWNTDAATRGLFVGTLDGAEPVRLTTGDGAGVVASGHLLYSQKGTLFAQPFDETSLKVSGTPIRIADGLPVTDFPAFSVSQDGVLAYRKGDASESLAELVWIDRSGKTLGTVGEKRPYRQIRLSPDQRRIVFASTDVIGSSDRVSVLDLGNGVATPLTDEKLAATDPVWSPSGDAIAFVAFGKGNEIFTQQIGSAGAVSVLEAGGRTQWLNDWSPDGKTMLLHVENKLYAATAGDSKSLKMVLDAPGPVDSAHFSPDGKWVAYQVAESGQPQVWIASFPAFDQRRQVSSDGGGEPVWRDDGSELFYLTPTGKLMSVRIGRSASGALDLAPPKELFQSPLPNQALVLDQYWVAKNADRFLFIRPVKTASAADQPITVVVNWTSQLRQGVK